MYRTARGTHQTGETQDIVNYRRGVGIGNCEGAGIGSRDIVGFLWGSCDILNLLWGRQTPGRMAGASTVPRGTLLPEVVVDLLPTRVGARIGRQVVQEFEQQGMGDWARRRRKDDDLHGLPFAKLGDGQLDPPAGKDRGPRAQRRSHEKYLLRYSTPVRNGD